MKPIRERRSISRSTCTASPGAKLVQRKRAEDDVERALRHRDRASVADGESHPRYATQRASRFGKDLGRAIGGGHLQQATLAIGPGYQGARDITAAGGQIENFGRAIRRDVVEQSWQVTQHGRDTTGKTIDDADVLKIGNKLSWIMVWKIEKLFGVYTVG